MSSINRKETVEKQWMALLVALISIGIYFRFTDLDRRIYWHDEAYTSLRASGYSGHDVASQLFGGTEFSAQLLMKFQQVGLEKDVFDAVEAMAISDPHHPPIYYLLSRLWMQWFGALPATLRSLAALLSILVFPSLYWFSMELFGSRRTALLAIALLSISPIHVIFAREAREYSLWTVTTLLSCAALLRALRLGSMWSWALYGFTLTLGLYSHLFHLFVALAHGLYVLITSNQLSGIRAFANRNLRAHALASFAAMIAYSPWIWVVFSYMPTLLRTTQWLATPKPFAVLLKSWIARYSGLLVDFDPFPLYLELAFVLPVIILIGYSLLFLWRRGARNSRLLIFLLIGLNAGLLISADLILGGWRSAIPRYQIPTYICLQLAVSYFLANQIFGKPREILQANHGETSTVSSRNSRLPFGFHFQSFAGNSLTTQFKEKRAWQLIIVVLFLVGILSNQLFVHAGSWWDKGSDFGRPEMIQMVNQADNPVLIIDASSGNTLGDILSFGHELDSHVQIRWDTEAFDNLNTEHSDIFVYKPSADSKRLLSERNDQELIPIVPGLLWKLVDK